MKRRNWKAWVAGIVLVLLLALGAGTALLWPRPPNEAEGMAGLVHPGMTWAEIDKKLDLTPEQEYTMVFEGESHTRGLIQKDGSVLLVVFGRFENGIVTEVRTGL